MEPERLGPLGAERLRLLAARLVGAGGFRRRLDTHRDEAQALLGKERLRLWRLYLGATPYYFRKGHLSIFQSLLAKPDEARAVPLPLSRAGLYRQEKEPEHPRPGPQLPSFFRSRTRPRA